MKTAVSLIALSSLAAFALAAPLFGQSKAGEKLAASRPPVSDAVQISKMNCPVETRTAIDRSASRGAFQKRSAYTAHLCASCETKEVTVGVGKLATRKTERSCKNAAVCCSVKQ